MSRAKQVFWAVSLCIFASGCSGYRTASLPSEHSAEEVGGSGASVEVGSEVKVFERSGKTIVGKVMGFEDGCLVLATTDGGESSSYRVEYSRIEKIEQKDNSSKLPLYLLGAIVVVVVVAAVMSATKENAAEAGLGTFE